MWGEVALEQQPHGVAFDSQGRLCVGGLRGECGSIDLPVEQQSHGVALDAQGRLCLGGLR